MTNVDRRPTEGGSGDSLLAYRVAQLHYRDKKRFNSSRRRWGSAGSVSRASSNRRSHSPPAPGADAG